MYNLFIIGLDLRMKLSYNQPVMSNLRIIYKNYKKGFF